MCTCNATHYTERFWSAQPPPPTSLRCASTGMHAGSLGVSVDVNVSKIDAVSFHVSSIDASESAAPFLGYVVPVTDTSGVITGEVPGLRTGVEYMVQARIHARGGDEGNPQTWSKLGGKVKCTSASLEALHRAPRSSDNDGPRTRWLEIYRETGLDPDSEDFMLQDYLDQHNACDLSGYATIIATTSPDATKSSTFVSRYCVEVLDVMLPNITTAEPSGEPQNSPFSDYLSCNSGECRCMHQVDRMISKLPAEQLNTMCHNPPADAIQNSCRCSHEKVKESNKYVGRTPLTLPVVEWLGMYGTNWTLPDWYPTPSHDSPMSHWYHFPSGGRCSPGERVGDKGCTWQLSPLSHSLSGPAFAALNTSGAIKDLKKNALVWPFEQSMHNLDVFAKAWLGMPVEVPVCGVAPGTLDTKAAMQVFV